MANRANKPKFRVGQVVCMLGMNSYGAPDEYGIVRGFDAGRWHIDFGGKDRKVLPTILRPLTKRERGA